MIRVLWIGTYRAMIASMTTPIIIDQLAWGMDEWIAVAGTLGAQASQLMRLLSQYPDDSKLLNERREMRGLESVSRRITNDAYARLAIALAIDAAHAADMAEHEAERMAGFLAGKPPAPRVNRVSDWEPLK